MAGLCNSKEHLKNGEKKKGIPAKVFKQSRGKIEATAIYIGKTQRKKPAVRAKILKEDGENGWSVVS